jgi:hypothetical protein
MTVFVAMEPARLASRADVHPSVRGHIINFSFRSMLHIAPYHLCRSHMKSSFSNSRNFIVQHSILATLLLLLVSLSSCVAPDARFSSLSTHVDRNPSPQAILGMWHFRHPTSQSLRTTLYFKADGTYLQKGKWGGSMLRWRNSNIVTRGKGCGRSDFQKER